MKSCSAINCTTRFKKGEKIKFHKFPKDPDVRKLWLGAVRRENFNPSEAAVICENHFNDNDYEINVHGNRVLKKGVVPSNFNFSVHSRRVRKRKSLKGLEVNQQPSVALSEEPAAECSSDTCPEEKSLEVDNEVAEIKIEPETEINNVVITGMKTSPIDQDIKEEPAAGCSPDTCLEETSMEVDNEIAQIKTEPENETNNVTLIITGINTSPIDQDIKEEPVAECSTDIFFDEESFQDDIEDSQKQNELEDQIDNVTPIITEVKSLSNENQVPLQRNRRDPVFFGDFQECDLEQPDKRKRFFKVATETLGKYKKMNKYYQCKINRYQQKILQLKTLVADLRKNKISPDQSNKGGIVNGNA